MRTKKFLAAAFIGLVAFSVTSCDDSGLGIGDSNRVVTDVPGEITSYVTQHFNDAELLRVEIDREYTGVNSYYEAYLDNGANIDFTKDLEAVEVYSPNANVPLSTLPQNIADYIQSNHENREVRSWEKYPNKYEVYLDSELEIFFDEQGNFLRYDD